MSVNQYATRAGKQYESDLMNYLRTHDIDVERLRLTGVEDEGDLLVRASHGHGSRYVIEAKRTKALDLAGWVTEAEAERDNYVKHRGYSLIETGFVVVHKRRGKGIGGSYVTTTLDEWLRSTQS